MRVCAWSTKRPWSCEPHTAHCSPFAFANALLCSLGTRKLSKAEEKQFPIGSNSDSRCLIFSSARRTCFWGETNRRLHSPSTHLDSSGTCIISWTCAYAICFILLHSATKLPWVYHCSSMFLDDCSRVLLFGPLCLPSTPSLVFLLSLCLFYSVDTTLARSRLRALCRSRLSLPHVCMVLTT